MGGVGDLFGLGNGRGAERGGERVFDVWVREWVCLGERVFDVWVHEWVCWGVNHLH